MQCVKEIYALASVDSITLQLIRSVTSVILKIEAMPAAYLTFKDILFATVIIMVTITFIECQFMRTSSFIFDGRPPGHVDCM